MTGTRTGGEPRAARAPGLPVPRLPRVAAAELLAMARDGLAAAAAVTGVDGAAGAQRYVCAHLAALRAAAAVLAARARPASGVTRRGRPASVWVLLPQVAPELGEWAAFFSETARTRAAVEGGRLRAVSAREADDLVRDAGRFIEAVGRLLGAAGSPGRVSPGG